MPRKKPSWVGPANPADAETNLLKPTVEQTSEQRAEAERMSPRTVVTPKDPKTKNTYKEPVQKRQKPKVKTTENLKAAEVRTPTNAELGRGVAEVSTAPKPKRNRKPRSTTKTGKKLDPKTGRIVAPRPGQVRKLNGKIVRVDESNIEEVTKETRTTVLPTAGRDKVEGASPLVSKPIQRVSVITTAPRPAAGPAGNAKPIEEMISQARQHLANMTLSRHNPDEYNTHHENFNLVHAQLQKTAPAAHKILGIMRHVTHNVTPESAGHFEAADQALGDTLKAYKAVSSGNVKSSRFGRQERLRRIRAEREGTPE
jgi:hypothetical protein